MSDQAIYIEPQGVTSDVLPPTVVRAGVPMVRYPRRPHTAYMISEFGILESLSVPVNIGWNRFPLAPQDSLLTLMGVVR